MMPSPCWHSVWPLPPPRRPARRGNPWRRALLIAVPGGAVLGVLVGMLSLGILQRAAGTLSLVILQFLITYGTWIVAERLELSPIMAVVALAAVIARYMPARTSARDRVNTNAVWATRGLRAECARVSIDGPAGATSFWISCMERP